MRELALVAAAGLVGLVMALLGRWKGAELWLGR